MAFPETSVLGAFFKSMVDLFQVSLVAISDAGLVFLIFYFVRPFFFFAIAPIGFCLLPWPWLFHL